MKKAVKKGFAVAAVLAAALSVSAQQSYKNASTNGVFGNDIDSYMDVNGYTDVKAGNFFGFVGFNGNVDNGFNMGYAHQFKKFFFGGYYAGTLPGFTIAPNTTKSDVTAAGYKTVTTTNTFDIKVTDETNNRFALSTLFGLPSIALKADLFYAPTNGSSFTSTTTKTNSKSEDSGDYNKSTTTTKTHNSAFRTAADGSHLPNLEVMVTAGNTLKFKGKEYPARYYAGISSAISDTSTYTTTKDNSKITILDTVYTTKGKGYDKNVSNKTENTIVFGAGSGLPLKQKKGYDQSLDVEIKNTFALPQANAYTDTKSKAVVNGDTIEARDMSKTVDTGALNYTLAVTPAYSGKINPAKNFSLGFKLACPVSLEFENEAYKHVTSTIYYRTVNGTLDDPDNMHKKAVKSNPTYETSRDLAFKSTIAPTVTAGGVYVIKPNKFDFNFGASLTVPSFEIRSTTTQTRAADNKKVTNKDTVVGFEFLERDTTVALTSGVTWYVAKGFTIDTNYNIFAGNIGTAMNVTAGYPGNYSIFNSINDIIVKNFRIQASIKL